MDPKSANPLGWNPCAKVLPKSSKKKSLFQGILLRHKNYLRNLEAVKNMERDEQVAIIQAEQAKFSKFRDNADRQRKKIQQLKVS